MSDSPDRIKRTRSNRSTYSAATEKRESPSSLRRSTSLKRSASTRSRVDSQREYDKEDYRTLSRKLLKDKSKLKDKIRKLLDEIEQKTSEHRSELESAQDYFYDQINDLIDERNTILIQLNEVKARALEKQNKLRDQYENKIQKYQSKSGGLDNELTKRMRDTITILEKNLNKLQEEYDRYRNKKEENEIVLVQNYEKLRSDLDSTRASHNSVRVSYEKLKDSLRDREKITGSISEKSEKEDYKTRIRLELQNIKAEYEQKFIDCGTAYQNNLEKIKNDYEQKLHQQEGYYKNILNKLNYDETKRISEAQYKLAIDNLKTEFKNKAEMYEELLKKSQDAGVAYEKFYKDQISKVINDYEEKLKIFAEQEAMIRKEFERTRDEFDSERASFVSAKVSFDLTKASFETEKDSKTREIEFLRSEVTTKDSQISKIMLELNLIKTENARLNSELETTRASLEELRHELDSTKTNFDNCSNIISSLESKNNEIINRGEQLNCILSEEKAKSVELNRLLHLERNRSLQLETTNKELRANLRTRENELRTILTNVNEIREELSLFSRNIPDSQKHLSDIVARFDLINERGECNTDCDLEDVEFCQDHRERHTVTNV